MDYDQDCSGALIGFEDYDQSKKSQIIEELKEYYQKLGQRVKKEYDFTLDYVKGVYSSAFGVSKKKIERIFNQKTSRYLKIYRLTILISFLLSVLSFIAVVLILAIGY